MIVEEVLSSKQDKSIGGLPREASRRRNGAAPRQPALWSAVSCQDVPEGVMGAFPKGFMEWASRLLCVKPHELLQLCAGMTQCGIGVDIRREVKPTICADGRQLPFRDNSFRGVLVDPPYTVEYARDLYGTDYPRPSHLLKEAARVVEPGRFIGILHFLVPMPPQGCKTIIVRGVTTGPGYRIRAFTVFQKEQDRML